MDDDDSHRIDGVPRTNQGCMLDVFGPKVDGLQALGKSAWWREPEGVGDVSGPGCDVEVKGKVRWAIDVTCSRFAQYSLKHTRTVRPAAVARFLLSDLADKEKDIVAAGYTRATTLDRFLEFAHLRGFLMSGHARIDSWRHSIPSRLEREDPFENDGFQARCSTRFTFREDDDSPDQPVQTSRLSSLRSRISSLRKRRRGAPSAAEAPSVRSQEAHSVSGPASRQPERPPACSVSGPEPGPRPCGKQSGPGLFGKAIFGRKRARSLTPPPPPRLLIPGPVKLKFLFVGDHGSGQTALL
ncbi:hypothetical protein E4U53_000809, partial [Claviceps sorghi]